MTIIDFLSGEKVFPAVISAGTTVVVFFATLFSKNFFETRVLASKLETEHRFEQQKQIKNILSKHKVHLVESAERLRKRLYSINYGNYFTKIKEGETEAYYQQCSSAYKLLVFYAWIKKFQSEMVFLDTTIAERADFEFVKFLSFISRIPCDSHFLKRSEKKDEIFYSTEFASMPDCVSTPEGIASYTHFEKVVETDSKAKKLFDYFDKEELNDDKLERLKLLHLSVILFLNNFGYKYQKTDVTEVKEIMAKLNAETLQNFYTMIKKYGLADNREIKKYFSAYS